MNNNPFHDEASNPDAAFNACFRVRPMASEDFARRTLEAVRARKRRARVIRFSLLGGGMAASFALLLGSAFWSGAVHEPAVASAPAAAEAATGPVVLGRNGPSSADELTVALHEAISKKDVVFYGQALALEALLANTEALTEEESRETLDFLFLVAGK